jgi:hypothetical protein
MGVLSYCGVWSMAVYLLGNLNWRSVGMSGDAMLQRVVNSSQVWRHNSNLIEGLILYDVAPKRYRTTAYRSGRRAIV